LPKVYTLAPTFESLARTGGYRGIDDRPVKKGLSFGDALNFDQADGFCVRTLPGAASHIPITVVHGLCVHRRSPVGAGLPAKAVY